MTTLECKYVLEKLGHPVYTKPFWKMEYINIKSYDAVFSNDVLSGVFNEITERFFTNNPNIYLLNPAYKGQSYVKFLNLEEGICVIYKIRDYLNESKKYETLDIQIVFEKGEAIYRIVEIESHKEIVKIAPSLKLEKNLSLDDKFANITLNTIVSFLLRGESDDFMEGFKYSSTLL